MDSNCCANVEADVNYYVKEGVQDLYCDNKNTEINVVT
jgi:hypothetical protein